MNKTKYVDCAGGIIINNKQEVVVVNQNHDSWSLPKGHIDDGETKLEAAIREIYEETGIENPKLIKPLGSFGRYRIGLDGEDDKSEQNLQHSSEPTDPETPQIDDEPESIEEKQAEENQEEERINR